MIELDHTVRNANCWSVHGWHIKGTKILHREDGPAVLYVYKDGYVPKKPFGNCKGDYYWLNGKRYEKSEWKHQLVLLAHKRASKLAGFQTDI